jgi:hypothetical protein
LDELRESDERRLGGAPTVLELVRSDRLVPADRVAEFVGMWLSAVPDRRAVTDCHIDCVRGALADVDRQTIEAARSRRADASSRPFCCVGERRSAAGPVSV